MPIRLFSGCFTSICRVIIVLLLIAFGLSTTAYASRLAGGATNTIVVQLDGTVLAWGSKTGDGTSLPRLNPVHVVDASGNAITGVQAVSSGYYHTVALKLDGTLLAWGFNNAGQLGDGTKTDRLYAVPVLDGNGIPFTGVQAIAVGEGYTIALKTDGTLWALGITPAQVLYESGDPVIDIQAVAAGGGHNLALKADGSLLAWGNNTYGQLGDGTVISRVNPMPVVDEFNKPVTGIQAITAGIDNYSVALKTDGSLLAWGKNTYGQLGDGTTFDHYYPAPVVDEFGESNTDILNISAGYAHTIALKSNGTVLSWGYNVAGQLGDLSITDRYNPVEVAFISCVHEVIAGRNHSVALKSDGALLAWGNNSSGQLGNGTKYNRSSPASVMNFALMDIQSVEAGGSSSFALKFDGTLLSWGANYQGLLGDGTKDTRRVSGFVVDKAGDPIEGIKSVSAQSDHVLALKSDGTILAWGDNTHYKLGDGTAVDQLNPVPVVDENGETFSGIQAISAGVGFSLALTMDGSVLAWGENDDGQLGNGTLVNQSHPVPVVDAFGNQITGIRAVSSGGSHALALKTDGTILAWGSNTRGQLGDGTAGDPEDGIYLPRYNPVTVVNESGDPITGVQAVYAGGQFSIALKTDGTLLAWGSNAGGTLCDGTYTNRWHPVPVLDATGNIMTGIKAVSAGMTHVLALQSDTGSILGWGNNSYGQLGNNEYTSSLLPVAVLRNSLGDLATNFRAMSAGSIHSVSLWTDLFYLSGIDGIASWGRNDYGQFGNGSTLDRFARPIMLQSTDYWLTPERASHLYGPVYLGVDSDNDGTVKFTSDAESIVEGDGNILLNVSRTCGSYGAVSIDYTTSNGTAAAGEDYTTQSGTLSWLDSDATTQQISIPITADSSEEGDETFMVTLSNISGASLGIPDTTTVTIINKTYADTDGDGVTDNIDAFLDDPAASVDTDSDGDPDDWNPGKTQADSTTGLILDLDDDSDGMPDDWETQYGLNPIVNDAEGDSDSDGINNLDEYLQGSSPLLKSGDVNLDGEILVPDAILTLKVLTSDDSQPIPEGADVNADVNADKVIGIQEAIFILKEASK